VNATWQGSSESITTRLVHEWQSNFDGDYIRNITTLCGYRKAPRDGKLDPRIRTRHSTLISGKGGGVGVSWPSGSRPSWMTAVITQALGGGGPH